METLVQELFRQGPLGLICVVLLLWLKSVMAERDGLKKENSDLRQEHQKDNEANRARIESLANRVTTVLEGNASALNAFSSKIDGAFGNQRLVDSLADLKEDVLHAIKGPGSRRQ